MIVALLFINILILLLLLVVIRGFIVFNDKVDIIRKDQITFHGKNAELWKENAEILRDTLQ